MKFFAGVLFGILGAIGIRWWVDEFIDSQGGSAGSYPNY